MFRLGRLVHLLLQGVTSLGGVVPESLDRPGTSFIRTALLVSRFRLLRKMCCLLYPVFLYSILALLIRRGAAAGHSAWDTRSLYYRDSSSLLRNSPKGPVSTGLKTYDWNMIAHNKETCKQEESLFQIPLNWWAVSSQHWRNCRTQCTVRSCRLCEKNLGYSNLKSINSVILGDSIHWEKFAAYFYLLETNSGSRDSITFLKCH